MLKVNEVISEQSQESDLNEDGENFVEKMLRL